MPSSSPGPGPSVPNEACGILAGDRAAIDGGRAIGFYPLTNAEASPFLYRIDPAEQLHAMVAIDDADDVVWGIFHSHVASPAEPSVTDIGLAFYPEALYLICSLADLDAPHIRAWSIQDGLVTRSPSSSSSVTRIVAVRVAEKRRARRTLSHAQRRAGQAAVVPLGALPPGSRLRLV